MKSKQAYGGWRRWLAGVLLFLLLFVGYAFFRDGTVILAYHSVSDAEDEPFAIAPAEFEQQLSYLAAQGYQTVSLAELFAAWSGRGSLPAKALVITFDDGYEDNLLTALPILQRHGMKATIFVIAGEVGNPGYLSWEQLKSWQVAGGEIGSHTFSHAALAELDAAERRAELIQSKTVLEAGLGTPVEFLAYPFGSVNKTVLNDLRQAGYQGACSGIGGINSVGMDSYALRRVNVPRPRCGLAEFRLRLLKAWLIGQWVPVRGEKNNG